MPREEFVKDLAKLVIAAAWADGEIQNEELNALKDLLFHLPEITGEEYAELETYMENRVGPEERDRLLQKVLAGIRSDNDRKLVVETITKLVEADGTVTDEEAALLESVKAAVQKRNAGFFPSLAKMISGALKTRTAKTGPVRELRVSDYIKNTIYFQLSSELKNREAALNLPEEKVRKLCLASGLMAKVAWVDSEISGEERQAIKRELKNNWNLNEEESQLILDMSISRVTKGLDHFRVCRGFFEATTPTERVDFLKCLFHVANACGKTSHTEILEIQKIANSIKVPHADLIGAKLAIPSEERGGL